jgi:ADP-heptose:LPS heptosyltransferase
MLKRVEAAGRKALANHVLVRFQPDQVLKKIPASVKLKRILLMRWDAIGDMMVCLPFFRKLCELFPEAETGIVVSRRNLPLLKHEKGFHTILYDGRPSTYIRSLILARRFRPDVIVDTRMHYDSTTSFIYGLVSGAKWRLSASNRDNRLPFSVRVPMPEERHHNADLTRILLEGLGKGIDDSELDREPRLSVEETEFINAFWRRIGLRFRGNCVGINISARDPRHRWTDEKTAVLCESLIFHGKTPLLMSTPSERRRAFEIAGSCPGILVAPECPTILHAAALIRDFALFVTPDTGLVHIAASFGIPVVGMYCPNELHLPLWYPWRVENEVLMDTEKVENITVKDVEMAVDRLMRRTAVSENT